MVTLTYGDDTHSCEPGESVLETLLRNDVDVPFSCRAGVCHSCLLRRSDGSVPPSSQPGLKPTLRERNYFLACQLVPDEDIAVSLPDDAQVTGHAVVVELDNVNEHICRVLLEPATPLYYHAGQYVNLRRKDGLARSYSLASVPSVDKHLEVHVRRLDNGRMSNWINDDLDVGDRLDFHGPYGDCFYLPGNADQELLLVGTGTGLAPLVGVVRDALQARHSGDIHLFHGCREPDDLYLHRKLRQLAEAHANFHYHACVSGDKAAGNVRRGRANELAFADFPNLSGKRVFLCGLPAMVHAARKMAYLNGAAMDDIMADAFEMTDLRKEERTAGAARS